MIEFDRITLRYGKQVGLDNISLSIKENTICGLLGRNGSGKTSLISLIASYRQPSCGNLRLWGENPYENQNVMCRVALIYDRAGKDDSLKVKEYLKSASYLCLNWDKDVAERLVNRFEVPINKPVSKLSHGTRSALWAIIGIASRAPLTIYDEAYGGMDAAVRKIFMQEILEDYMLVPRTIIFTTHYISEAENAFEDVIILDGGKVLAHESCDSLRQKGAVVTGNTETVDGFLSGKTVLSERTLGSQKEAVLFGILSEQEKREAINRGLAVTKPGLQDLFIHMTGGQQS